ncbi:peptidoglycan-binding protein [Microvirga vignae]|uniref:peptidoglycan-binding protein n=1 Tax=Microvirga vignae TaxID=1225564 RepID=UPI00069A0C25|nr:peptidoglycan-binding protein [Microvirga vignae]
MKKLRGFIFISLLLIAWTNAQAAQIELIPSKDLALITVEGEFQYGDDDVFKQKVFLVKEAMVLFNSVGGNLIAGIEIGKAIRLKGFDTVVPDDMLCASACGLAWLGGKTRWAGPGGRIAFHAAWKLENGKKVETGPGNALVGAYLHSLGLSEDAIVYITSAPPDGAEMLSFRKAELLGMHVKRFEVPPEQRQLAAKPELPQRSVPADPEAGYYDPNARTLAPVTTNPAQLTETKTAALPPVQTPSYAIGRPEGPLMDPQVLELANLDAAAQVQRRLQERGFFHGLVDGVWGQRSRIALRDFKIRNGLGSDDRWDLRTQLAIFDDQYPAAPVAYVPVNPEQDVRGLFTPFAPPKGATLHPLNPRDALKIQSRLSELSYYRKTGDGVWGMASRSALTDFKVANGLSADDVWDGIVEEKIEGP